MKEMLKKIIKDFIERKSIYPNNQNRVNFQILKVVLEDEKERFINYAKKIKHSLTKEELDTLFKYMLKKENESNFIDKLDILELLKYRGLNTEERREEFKKKTEELTELLIKMINGSKEGYEEFNTKYQENVFNNKTNKYTRYIPLGIVIMLFNKEEYKEILDENSLIQSTRFSYFKYLISDFQYEFGVKYGFREKKKGIDLLEDTKKMVLDFSEEENEEEGLTEEERLRLENRNYKESLKLIEQNFSELKSRFQEEADEAKKIAIGEFYCKLNSDKYGKFLDKVPYAEELLTKIRKEKLDKEIPSEVKIALMFVKQVIKFIKDSGIETIEEYNRVFEATAEEIAEMEYRGESSFEEGEKKILKVESPGYKYADIIISIPVVVEVIKND